MSEDKRIQVISRAVNVLKSIGSKPDGMSLGEIAKQIYLPALYSTKNSSCFGRGRFYKKRGSRKKYYSVQESLS